MSVQSPGPQRLGPGSSLGPHLPGPAHPGVPPSYLDVHHAGMHPLFGACPPPWQPWEHSAPCHGPIPSGPIYSAPWHGDGGAQDQPGQPAKSCPSPPPMEGSLQRDSAHRQLIQVQADPRQPAPTPLIHQLLQPPPGFPRLPWCTSATRCHSTLTPAPVMAGWAQAHPWTHPVHPSMAPPGPALAGVAPARGVPRRPVAHQGGSARSRDPRAN